METVLKSWMDLPSISIHLHDRPIKKLSLPKQFYKEFWILKLKLQVWFQESWIDSLISKECKINCLSVKDFFSKTVYRENSDKHVIISTLIMWLYCSYLIHCAQETTEQWYIGGTNLSLWEGGRGKLVGFICFKLVPKILLTYH